MAGVSVPAARAWLARSVADQRDRWFLWLAPGFGAGIALYFALPEEPPLWVGGACALIAVPALLFRRFAGAPVVAVVAAAGLGVSVALLHTARVDAPVLEKRIGPVAVSGVIESASPDEANRWRLVLARPVIERLAPEDTPVRVRINVRRVDGDPAPGRLLHVRAALLPPPEPVAPGAFDFARRAYFQRLGAVGFAYGRARVTRVAGASGIRARLNAVRHAVTARIMAGLSYPENAIAAALITGERRAIPSALQEAVRAAGLAHLLAISGLHFALVAGLLYAASRTALACIPYVALRFPIKKWAAAGAFGGACAYLAISGASIPSQRAFLMLAIVLLAVVLDRTPISMRLVAVAAAAVLALSPESLLGPSFQLSFAAVVALVAFYEANARRIAAWGRDLRWARRTTLYVLGIALTTVIAGAATAPFAVHHFNRFAVYGVAANLVAVPIAGLWIMPWAIVALALMPLGLDSVALAPMGWGIDAVVRVAREVASWPGAVLHVPAVPDSWPILVGFGGLWLALWRGPLRLAGLFPLAAAAAAAALERPPDVILGRQPQAYAVRVENGGLAVSPGTRGFARAVWLERAGRAEAVPWRGRSTPDSEWFACGSLGCIRSGGPDRPSVAIVTHPAALAEDCPSAEIVLGSVAIDRRACRGPRLVVDQRDRYRRGAHAIWLDGGPAAVKTVAGYRGRRPWTSQYRRYKAASVP